jgi:phosphonopyruvate decarboxylase
VIDTDLAFQVFEAAGIGFWTGVPDSLLKDFGAYVLDHAPEGRHVIAANEGGAVAIAAGHYLASGSPALVYLQNSGLGNTLNPLISLADPAVYRIPMVLLIGWRGEPGQPDEPQHRKQGQVTLPVLEAVGIPSAVLPNEAPEASTAINTAVASAVAESRPYALVVRKGTFAPYQRLSSDRHSLPLSREDAVIVVATGIEDTAVLVSTTGKASRELYEFRIRSGTPIERDFLTVGSMGHASQIALGIALTDPDRPVWVLDGDGALLMHLGSLAVIGEHAPSKFKHVVLNNHVHDSVGGQPAAGDRVDIPALALAAGYRQAHSVSRPNELATAIETLRNTPGPALLEVEVRPGARADLGRPAESPMENRTRFMEFLEL